MTEERDDGNRCQSQFDSDTDFPDLQAWFERSVEELPRAPFTPAVLEQVQRRERRLRWQRHAARLVAFASFCLLVPELIVLLNALAALPLVMTAIASKHWPVLVLAGMLPAWWLIGQAGKLGLLRGGWR